jgi:hypothetical protein
MMMIAAAINVFVFRVFPKIIMDKKYHMSQVRYHRNAQKETGKVFTLKRRQACRLDGGYRAYRHDGIFCR